MAKRGGFRFRKSFKVAPGVRINVGKKSVGVSAGPKGFKVRANTKTGVRSSVSIPGTGIGFDQNLSPNLSKRKRNTPQKSSRSQTSVDVEPIDNSDLYVKNAQEQYDNIIGIVKKSSGAKIHKMFKTTFPELRPPLAFSVTALIFGLFISLAGFVWGWIIFGYGVIAFINNTRLTKNNRRIVVSNMDEALSSLEAINHQDEARARLIHRHFTETGEISKNYAPNSVSIVLGQDEQALVDSEALKLKPDNIGLRRFDYGKLLVTNKNLYFLGSESNETIAINRVLQAVVEPNSVLKISVKNRNHLLYEIPGNAATTGTIILTATLLMNK